MSGMFALDFANSPTLTAISLENGFIRYQEITGSGFVGTAALAPAA